MEFKNTMKSEASLINRANSLNLDEESISIAQFFEIHFFKVKCI